MFDRFRRVRPPLHVLLFGSRPSGVRTGPGFADHPCLPLLYGAEHWPRRDAAGATTLRLPIGSCQRAVLPTSRWTEYRELGLDPMLEAVERGDAASRYCRARLVPRSPSDRSTSPLQRPGCRPVSGGRGYGQVLLRALGVLAVSLRTVSPSASVLVGARKSVEAQCLDPEKQAWGSGGPFLMLLGEPCIPTPAGRGPDDHQAC